VVNQVIDKLLKLCIPGEKLNFKGGYFNMGHDISGYNKAQEEIAYARFSMGNRNAIILYSLLDATKFYAGVSGCGDSCDFSIQQFEKALDSYNQLCEKHDSLPKSDSLPWDQKQIHNFLLNCLRTAQKEGSVEVYFG
jgi:hypothetical protein